MKKLNKVKLCKVLGCFGALHFDTLSPVSGVFLIKWRKGFGALIYLLYVYKVKATLKTSNNNAFKVKI